VTEVTEDGNCSVTAIPAFVCPHYFIIHAFAASVVRNPFNFYNAVTIITIIVMICYHLYAEYLQIYDLFINCNWVVTRWQYTFTHEHYTEQHT
jgi:hypothetical protein